MLRVSETLVDWLIESGRCVKHGSKEYYAQNAAQLMYEGTLTGEDYKEFSKADEYDDTPNGTKSVEELLDAEELDELDDDATAGDVESRITNIEKSFMQLRDVLTDGDEDMTAEKLFSGRNGGSISVKTPSGQYCEKRYEAKNKHGLTVFDPIAQRNVMTQSQQQKAEAGVLFKHLASRAGISEARLNEHERELLTDLAMSKSWCGKMGSEYYDEISGGTGLKAALIDDAISGGIEAVPIAFDDSVVSFPLLGGELFPMVDLHPISRGRRIEGASIQTPTMAWGGVDGTDISLFNTASMIAAIDTTIFAIDGAVEVGRDFLSDSPVNIGQTLTALVGERLSAELDKVIASGSGTDRPEGILTATGLTTVITTNGNAGPPVLADYLSLLFAIGKQYRTPANRVAFISNDTTYQRSRGMKVDPQNPSGDTRAVLNPSMDNFGGSLVNAYATLGYPHKVQNDIGNASCAVVAMSKYRMYRRLGLEMRFETGGKQLARANSTLLIFRARYGARLVDSGAAAKWANGQS